MSRARLGAYALWQLRDYVLRRGLPTMIIGALLILQVWVMRTELRATVSAREVTQLVSQLLVPFVLIAVLVAVNGIISDDRRQGYFRFLFAKPLSIPAYYLQAFLLHGLGVMAATALFLLAIWGVTGVATPAWTVLYSLAYYVLLGGIGFLFSAFLRSDWVLLAGTIAIAHVADLRFGDDAGFVGWSVRWLLPPFRLMGEIREALITGSAPAMWPAIWPVLYGCIAVAAGVLVLRRRALG